MAKDGQPLRTGKRVLRFVYTPLVHWPETMVTYEETENIFFPYDAFGSCRSLRGSIFGCGCADPASCRREMLRRPVNIVRAFSGAVGKDVAKLAGVSVSCVAPSRGAQWHEKPEEIVQLYERWAADATEPTELGITMICGSVYGNTEEMMNAVARGGSTGGRIWTV